jgi:nitrogen fixation NifU-like protein
MNGLLQHNDDELRDLYRELILDHARHPRHFGTLPNATHTAAGINPLCGDKLTLYIYVNGDQAIDAIAFEGTGCAISMASASLMTDILEGLDTATAERYFEAVTQRLAGKAAADVPGLNLEKLHALDGVREFPSRVKCATLAWHALHSALANQTTPATTE